MFKNYDEIVKLAWHDKTSFDVIKRKFNISENDVICIMRANLKSKSFKLWRKRVSGRRSKHQKKSEILSSFENYKINPNEIY
ncbi:TIGR03643 family protein [Alphaproteobacteria bacterium]|nr:TIGR03643 family protein [Alphaproteobacteria bacterium]